MFLLEDSSAETADHLLSNREIDRRAGSWYAGREAAPGGDGRAGIKPRGVYSSTEG